MTSDTSKPREVESLGTALPKVMTYVRDTLIPRYQSIGPAGGFAIAMMRADLDAAQKAMIEGDTVEMIRRYKSLSEYET